MFNDATNVISYYTLFSLNTSREANGNQSISNKIIIRQDNKNLQDRVLSVIIIIIFLEDKNMIQSLDKTCIHSYKEQVTKSETSKFSSFCTPLYFYSSGWLTDDCKIHSTSYNCKHREATRPFIVIFLSSLYLISSYCVWCGMNEKHLFN